MGEQVVDTHFALWGFGCVIVPRAFVPNLQISKGWNVMRDGVDELQFAFFIQHHQCQRGDRLGHGIDAEDAVFFQR